MPVLEMVGVSKAFSCSPLLSSLSLTLEAGQVMGILGSNGIGKTTLLRLVAGLETVEEGTIRWQGELWSERHRHLPPWQRPLGMMFQAPTLWPHMTVRNHLEFVLTATTLSRYERRQRARQWMHNLELEDLESRFPSELSGGQQSRVALARALVRHPPLLLLDEPFAALDGRQLAQCWAQIEKLTQETQTCVLLVTQDRHWAETHLTRRIVLGDPPGP